jgi:hypothetical protein
MERAYLAAVEASDACNDKLKESMYLDAMARDTSIFEMLGQGAVRSKDPAADIRRAGELHLEQK